MTAEQTFDKWCDISQPMDLSVVKLLAITAMKEYAEYKCLEAIKNTRYKSYYLVGHRITGNQQIDNILQDIQRDIQNIPNQDVLPEQ